MNMASLFDDVETPKQNTMTDDDLCAEINRHMTNSVGYNDTFSEDRRKALSYYMGEAKGDLAPPEVEGRSKVVSRDVLDTVEWIMPSLMRAFAGSEDVVAFEAKTPDAVQGAQDATTYVNYIINQRNNGFLVLHDAIKSALVQRIGLIKVWWDESSEVRQETYRGLSDIELQGIAADESVTIIKVEQSEDGSFDVVAQTNITHKFCKIDSVPPEEVRISKLTRSADDCPFIAHEREVTLSELRAMGFDEAKIDAITTNNDDDEFDTDKSERLSAVGIDDSGTYNDSGDESQQTAMLEESYLRVDYDGDGIAEWRCVFKVGSVILSNEICDDHPFAIGSPVLMPHTFVGLSVYDLMKDLQQVKTVLQRQMLDNLYLTNNARTEVATGANLDDLLNPRPGGLVRVQSLGSIREIYPPQVVGQSLQSIEFFSRVGQSRSGVTEFNQGMQAEAVNKSTSGVAVELMQNGQMQRIELMARVFAETLIKRLYRLVLKCVCQYQRTPEQVMINGRPFEFNPREWSTGYQLRVSVGLGASSRQSQIANLNNVLTMQKEALAAGMIEPQYLYNTIKRIVEVMGYKDVNQFFPDPSIQPPKPPQEPPIDPAIQVEQLRAQGKAQELAAKQAADERDAQLRAQEIAMRNEAERQNDERAAQIEKYKADLESQTKLQVEAMKAEADRQLEILKKQLEQAPIVNHNNEFMGAMQSQMQMFESAINQIVSSINKPKLLVRDENGRAIGTRTAE